MKSDLLLTHSWRWARYYLNIPIENQFTFDTFWRGYVWLASLILDIIFHHFTYAPWGRGVLELVPVLVLTWGWLLCYTVCHITICLGRWCSGSSYWIVFYIVRFSNLYPHRGITVNEYCAWRSASTVHPSGHINSTLFKLGVMSCHVICTPQKTITIIFDMTNARLQESSELRLGK